MSKIVWSVLAVATGLGLASVHAEAQLSDGAAAKIIEAYWETQTYAIFVGQVVVVRDGFTVGNHIISESIFNKQYMLLAKLGAIKVVQTKAAQSFNQGNSFSWGQLLGTTTQGILNQVVVTPSDTAQKLNVSKDPGLLELSLGKQRVDRIVGNEPARKGIDDYRIVRLLYTIAWNTYMSDAMAVCGAPRATAAQQAIVLLKFDPFSSQWKFVTEDDANAGTDLCTNNVARALQ